MRDLDKVADVVVLTIKTVLGPVLERLAAAEARLAVLGDLRDRVVTVETKAAMPLPDLSLVQERLAFAESQAATLTVTSRDLADVRDRIVRLETKSGQAPDLGEVRERLAVLETRPQLPGPSGEPGPPGKDGVDGKDGTAGLTYQGVYQDGKSYDVGDVTTYASSTWHCNEATTSKPGDGSKAWTLMVKRGRDGKDGRDAPGALPVVSVGRPS